MNEKEQIEEMARFLQHEGHCLPLIESSFVDNECNNGTEKCSDCKALEVAAENIATNLYNAGYRKQSVCTISDYTDGDYTRHIECSGCGCAQIGDIKRKYLKYCPNCGARLKEYGAEVEK